MPESQDDLDAAVSMAVRNLSNPHDDLNTAIRNRNPINAVERNRYIRARLFGLTDLDTQQPNENADDRDLPPEDAA